MYIRQCLCVVRVVRTHGVCSRVLQGSQFCLGMLDNVTALAFHRGVGRRRGLAGVAQINAVLTHLATDNLELATLLMRRPSCETLGLLLTTPNSKPRPSPPGLFLCWSGKSASGKDVVTHVAERHRRAGCLGFIRLIYQRGGSRFQVSTIQVLLKF